LSADKISHNKRPTYFWTDPYLTIHLIKTGLKNLEEGKKIKSRK